jgi:hypothetical protein
MGLVALWRETLLAQAVLAGKTKGYKNHPQLNRFKECRDPLAAIGNYLTAVNAEATKRGYDFNHAKILRTSKSKLKIAVTKGQLDYEFLHLKRKLKKRDRVRYDEVVSVSKPEVHPLFKKVAGPIAPWEIVS